MGGCQQGADISSHPALLWNAGSGNVACSARRPFLNLSYEVHCLFGLCPRGMVTPWCS